MARLQLRTYSKLRVFETSSDFAAATKVVQVPLVLPGAGRIRVRNHFCGVNASDVNIAAGGVVPFDIGGEGLGVVDEVGEGVECARFKVGQNVLYFGRAAYSEYIVSPRCEMFEMFTIVALHFDIVSSCFSTPLRKNSFPFPR